MFYYLRLCHLTISIPLQLSVEGCLASIVLILLYDVHQLV